jgi:hypothetical protein
MFVDQRPNGFDLLMLILALLGPVIVLVLVLLGGR